MKIILFSSFWFKIFSFSKKMNLDGWAHTSNQCYSFDNFAPFYSTKLFNLIWCDMNLLCGRLGRRDVLLASLATFGALCKQSILLLQIERVAYQSLCESQSLFDLIFCVLILFLLSFIYWIRYIGHHPQFFPLSFRC